MVLLVEVETVMKLPAAAVLPWTLVAVWVSIPASLAAAMATPKVVAKTAAIRACVFRVVLSIKGLITRRSGRNRASSQAL